MPVFQYRVARSDGKTLEGQIEGDSEGAARAQLEGQGLLVFQLRKKGGWGSVQLGAARHKGKVPSQDFLIFNQELLALIRAGLPILKVWDLLIEQTKEPGFRAVLEVIRQDIRGGASASEALSRHPSFFSELYIASIRAGEHAGNLVEVLQRYIAHLKLMIGLRQKLVKALAYPTFLVLISMGVMAVLLLFVVPSFMGFYADRGQSLPEATRLLLDLVGFLQANFLPGVVILLGTGIAFHMWYRTTAGRVMADRLLLDVPWVGDVVMKQHAIQFTRTLATVLSGGTPLVEALQICRGAVSNRFLADGVSRVTVLVREGEALSPSLTANRILPRMALEMLSVGEETGSLETMLRDVADFYENELDYRLGQLATWIEAAVLLLMGVIIGTIVVVMYLPIFQMAGAV